MSPASYVLDSSALLALLNDEPGGQRVWAVLQRETALLLSVNLTEILTRLADWKIPLDAALERLHALPVDVVGFDESLAVAAAALRDSTRHRGLSLGDRACLALGQQLGATVLTADRAWAQLDVGVTIECLRP
ncbi:MAG: type II toxin-antitoxin system VapC family toxin [Polycyclovorans sp.]